jgi:hypothetical protein
MLSLLLIGFMVVIGFRILWDGRVPVNKDRVATGFPARVLAFALLGAAPLAYGIEVAIAVLHQRGWLFAGSLEQREVVFWCVLFGAPVAAIVFAAAQAQPVSDVPPVSDDTE